LAAWKSINPIYGIKVASSVTINMNAKKMSFPPDDVRIEVFTLGDEDDIVRLWNKVAESEKDICNLTVEAFKSEVIDNPNFDPDGAFLAYSGETLVGFCLVTIRREPFRARSLEEFPAFISAIMVHPSYRRRGIASMLISEAVEYARIRGKREIRTGFDNPIPLFIGIDVDKQGILNFFHEMGFEEEVEIVMRLSLSEFEKEEEIKQLRKRVENLGVLVMSIEKQDVQGMLELLREQAVWWYEPMVKDIESGRLDMTNVFLAKEGERTIGFVRVDKIGENGEVWGILTSPDKRCKGIGTLLLFSAINKLKKDGVKIVDLTTGNANFPAQRIYGKAGFTKTGAFAMFRKQL